MEASLIYATARDPRSKTSEKK